MNDQTKNYRKFGRFFKYSYMKLMALRLLATAFIIAISTVAFSQTTTNTDVLNKAAVQQLAKEKLMQEKLQTLAKQKGWEMVIRGPQGRVAILVGVDEQGYPEYITTDSNIGAAATIGTNKLWPGGSTGLNLTGSSNSVKNKLAIWDGGSVRSTHVELINRVVQRDAAPSGIDDHATHVSGTLIASGVNPLAKGMSNGQQQLVAYDFNNDNSEMMTEASGLLLSNHSYGEISGWYYNSGVTPARWEFRGRFDENEDYKFGYYSAKGQLWDSIAYNAPYYLIVKSSGNNRNVNGPAVGQGYYRFDATGAMTSAGLRPDGISSNDAYDVIPSYGTAKNILTIGAVNIIASGYTKPSDVVMSTFSSWGPTDDGRIKPDVVAAGVNLLSSIATADNAYDSYSGTSMASPNTTGSLLLLQEYYSQLHPGTFMRSATLKGLVIHTADEAGFSPGPDYQHGWGLINMPKAAAAITSNNTRHLIQEAVLNNGNTFSQNVVATGEGPLVATISWTDPKGVVEPLTTALNNPTKRLVHDLDIVVKKGATTYQPWVLSPSVPSAAATKGNNNTDNVEKVTIDDVVPGQTYTIEITHKGTLERGSQAYSLIVSGVGGIAYCASNPTSTAGARIDSVSLSNITNKNVAGCTSYSNFTNLIASVQPGQTLPFFARLTSCDATSVDKIVKVFMDTNNDGDFADAGETLATSAVINGNGNFTGNITIPSGMAVGYTSILRIVMQETNSAAAVTPCGTYAKGETQDYRIVISAPAIDAGVAELVSPSTTDCRSTEQYATVRIRNYGTSTVSNIPLSLEVKQGATTVATLNATFTGTITAGTDAEYTFQTTFALAANTAYTFTASTAVANDQVSSNNQLVTTITTGANAVSPTGTANICGSTAQLVATSAATGIFSWYSSAAATTAIAIGSSTTSNNILPTYYLSAGEYGTKVGPTNKMAFAEGGYNQFSPGIRFVTSAPTVLKTARLYIGNSGKITFHLRKLASFNDQTGGYTYFPVSSKTLTVANTTAVPIVQANWGQQNNDPTDPGAIYYLGITIPEAAEYILAIEFADGSSIFRNNNIVTSNYPYTVPGLMSITGNTAFVAGNPSYPQAFYYYLYDVALKPLSGCPSARTTIVATTSTAPVITNNANVLSSNFVDGNQWYLNGTAIPGATGQNHTAVASGVYTVTRSDAQGCSLTSNQITLTLTPVTDIGGAEIALTVSPNPARGPFNLQLETKTKANLVISLVNSLGQEVYSTTLPDFIGKLSKEINPGSLASGVYYLKIQHNKKAYSKKIIIAQ